MISVQNIFKTYDDVEALKGLSFKVEKGSIYGLLGPNGSGKTTTIRIILSIIYPDNGKVETNFSAIGYLPEERGLYPKMQIDELIQFFGDLRGMNRKLVNEQMDFWLQRFELMSRKEDRVEELSKGLKQRLHLLISVLHNPEFLILDEPFTGLDPIAIKGLRELVMEFKKRGKTILLSTHWMDQAEQLCDSVCLIKNGKKVYEGKLKQLKESHRKNDIYLEVDGNIALKSVPGIFEVNRKDDGYIIKTNISPAELIRDISEKAKIIEFRLVSPSLEEIFIKEVESEKSIYGC